MRRGPSRTSESQEEQIRGVGDAVWGLPNRQPETSGGERVPADTGPGGLAAETPEIVSPAEPARRAPASQHFSGGAVWREAGPRYSVEDASKFTPGNAGFKQVEDARQRGETGKRLCRPFLKGRRDQKLVHRNAKNLIIHPTDGGSLLRPGQAARSYGPDRTLSWGGGGKCDRPLPSDARRCRTRPYSNALPWRQRCYRRKAAASGPKLPKLGSWGQSV